MRLDRDGLEYLLSVAGEIGFGMMEMDTRETLDDAPIITIKFRQTKEPKPPPVLEAYADSDDDVPWKPKLKATDLKTLDE